VDAASQKEGGASMPKIVPADRGEARVLEEWLEVVVDYVLSVQRGTLACGENEIRLFVGISSSFSSSWCLRMDMAYDAEERRQEISVLDSGL
jgi:hypothetical protein